MGKEQPQKCYNQAFIGCLCSRIPTCLLKHVIGVKGQAMLENEI